MTAAEPKVRAEIEVSPLLAHPSFGTVCQPETTRQDQSSRPKEKTGLCLKQNPKAFMFEKELMLAAVKDQLTFEAESKGLDLSLSEVCHWELNGKLLKA